MKKFLTAVVVFFTFIGAGMVNVAGNNSFVPAAQAKEYTQVQAMHILVPTEQLALDIRKEIMQGKNQTEIYNNFVEAAKTYSKCPSGASGGMLGWFKRGVMVSEFEEAAFSMPVGEVSEPIETQFGWHLIYDISKK